MGLNMNDVEPIERDAWAVYDIEKHDGETERQAHRIVGMAIDASEDTNDAVLLNVLPNGHVEPITRIADNEVLVGVAYSDEERQALMDGH